MKIRNGFVSNSSSSSFLILSKNAPKVPKRKSKWPELISVDVIEEEYGRCRNEVLKSIEDKLRFVITHYAISYNEWRDFNEDLYIEKMIAFKEKIRNLGKKYNYKISITPPPIFFYQDTDYDDDGKPLSDKKIFKDLKVSTEWYEGVDLIKDVVEDEDTSRLERLLFNPQSFLVVGGDEYEESYRLAYLERQKMNEHRYHYDIFGADKNTWGIYEPCYMGSGNSSEDSNT